MRRAAVGARGRLSRCVSVCPGICFVFRSISLVFFFFFWGRNKPVFHPKCLPGSFFRRLPQRRAFASGLRPPGQVRAKPPLTRFCEPLPAVPLVLRQGAPATREFVPQPVGWAANSEFPAVLRPLNTSIFVSIALLKEADVLRVHPLPQISPDSCGPGAAGLLFLPFHSAPAKAEGERAALLWPRDLSAPLEKLLEGPHRGIKPGPDPGPWTPDHGSAVLQQRLRPEV